MASTRSTPWSVLVICMLSGIIAAGKYEIPNKYKEKEQEYWLLQGLEDINDALNKPILNKVAKNVIIFLGDGMGITVTTAGRIFKGQKSGRSGEEESLVWEKFPNLALIKTYNLDKQVPDSAATSTAFLGGVKGNFQTVGVNGKVVLGDCQASLKEENHVSSILKWCQDDGKDTGFITSTSMTHATLASLYAHTAHRYWECDLDMKKSKENTKGCKDIARQFVEDLPGKNINVVLAGGRRQMGAPLSDEENSSCLRNDSRNLVKEWLHDKEKRGMTSAYATNTKEVREIDVENVDYILGLFAENHFPFSYQRNGNPEGGPSLKELTSIAIRRLQRSSEGYFLLVEGGRIDHGLHNTKPLNALEELLAFEEAVEVALQLTDQRETLIIVTADHSHVMTINGYPSRGNDILGQTDYKFATDGMPYSTLMFTNGIGANFTIHGDKVLRMNVTGVNTAQRDFIPQSVVPTKPGRETHSGEDVAAYAIGPMAHLLHRVHEQTYIAHVMGYAACVGPFKDSCARNQRLHKHIYDINGMECQSHASSFPNIQQAFIFIMIIHSCHLIRFFY